MILNKISWEKNKFSENILVSVIFPNKASLAYFFIVSGFFCLLLIIMMPKIKLTCLDSDFVEWFGYMTIIKFSSENLRHYYTYKGRFQHSTNYFHSWYKQCSDFQCSKQNILHHYLSQLIYSLSFDPPAVRNLKSP